MTTQLLIAGQSGGGLVSIAGILQRALHACGYGTFSDREYPSVIKGGHSCVHMAVSQRHAPTGLAEKADVLLAIDREGLDAYAGALKDGGTLLHGFERAGIRPTVRELEARGVTVLSVPARSLAEKRGGGELMKNVVLLAAAWQFLGQDAAPLLKEIRKKFAHKTELLAINIACAKAGSSCMKESKPLKKGRLKKGMLLNGHEALAAGAVAAGCRAYMGYPMSPSSNILAAMSQWAQKEPIVFKQAEDEITAAQMALGASFMGVRALTATSGGGFDLMSETVSLSAITETPLVIVVAQRPGPATGLPTWTCQADLRLALHAGHGEFPRIIIAPGSSESCYYLMQHTFNLAEEYQSPAVVLTDKYLAESIERVEGLKQKSIPMRRGLVSSRELETLQPTDRYAYTENGVSKRWLPGTSTAWYHANGDEHAQDGRLTEDADTAEKMQQKRMRKLEAIKKALPEPNEYGEKGEAALGIICWGSTIGPVKEALGKHTTVAALHFEYVWPLRTKKLTAFFRRCKKVIVVEANTEGQLASVIYGETGLKPKAIETKINGRPFYVCDINNYIATHE